LIAKSQYGCSDTLERNITAYRAWADFVVDDGNGCSPHEINITNQSKGSVTEVEYLWEFGNGDGNETIPQPANPRVYNNTTAGVINPNLSLTVTSNDGYCSTLKSEPITVYPEIHIDNITLSSDEVCDSTSVTLAADIVDPALPNVSYEWDFDDGTSASVTNPAMHIFRNINNSSYVDRNVRLDVETEYGCSDNSTVNVRVHPRIRAFFTMDASSGCSPDTITVTPAYYPGISEYAWDFDGDGTIDETSAAAVPQTHVFPRNTSTTNANDIYDVTLTVRNSNSACTKDFSRENTVFAEAKAVFEPLDTIDCNPLEFTFRNNSVNPDIYSWDFDDGTTSSAAEPTHTFTNTGGSIKPFDVNLKVTTTNGCTHDTTRRVRVRPFINADFDIDISEDCSPLTVNISNNSSGTEFYWFWDDNDLTLSAADNTTSNPATHTYINTSGTTRTDSLTLIVGNGEGCYDTLKRGITIHSSINAGFTYDQPSACNPSEVEFTDTTFNAHIHQWNFGDGSTRETTTPTVTKEFTNTTDADVPYTVTLTAVTDEGCQSTVSHDVTVSRYVDADFDVNITEDCSPLTVTIDNNSRGGNYRWYWDDSTATGAADRSSTTDSETFTHEYTNTSGSDRIFYLTLVAQNSDGCSDTLTRGILVHSSITADFSFVQNDACNPSDVVFTNTSTGGGSYTTSWDFDDGSSLTTTTSPVNKTFTNNTVNDKTFNVLMTAESENGCTDSHSETITVYSKVIADFSMEENEGCPPFTTTIMNTSVGNANNQYTWYVDGAIESASTGLADFNHTYENTTISLRPYQVRLVAENQHGCTSEYIDTVTVYEYVEASFAMDDDAGCTPHEIQFTDLSAVPPSTKYTWRFGDGATSGTEEPSHKFYNSDREDDRDYDIKLTVQSPNYCSDDTTQSITVYHQPLAKFFIDNTSSCPPLFSFMDKSESLGEDMFEWRFGDGSAINTTNDTLTHRYESTGNGVVDPYELELWVGTNEGCKDSTSLTVNVFPSVNADFNFDYIEDYCSPSEVQFDNASSDWVTTYYWRFDDGNNTTNAKDPKYRYEITMDNDMVYNVFLRVASEYNCWDTITKPVPVFAQPNANFDAEPVLQKFPESSVTISNNTNYGPFDYLWGFGDLESTGSDQRDPNPNPFVYDHWGEKNISLTVTSQTSSCSDTLTKKVTILPPDVTAEFEPNPYEGCLNDGLEVEFTAGTSAYGDNYYYRWDFGDGNRSETDAEPGENSIIAHTYTQPGTYYVKLTVISQEDEALQDYEYETIRVYPNPIANFELLPSVTMLDAETLEARVEFYNQSTCNDTSGCSYLWDFGDGTTSIATNVTHYYEKPPDDEIPKKFDIKLVATNSHGCVDSMIQVNAVEVIGEGDIAFPNAFTPNEDGINDIFKPVYKGVVEYELLIYNRWGELIFRTNDLEMGWDGKVGDKLAKSDVYVWKAEGKFTNGRAFELAGDVTLIR